MPGLDPDIQGQCALTLSPWIAGSHARRPLRPLAARFGPAMTYLVMSV